MQSEEGKKFYGRFLRPDDFLLQDVAKLRNDFRPFFAREMAFCNAVQNSANSLGSIMSPLL
jgi:hypothetical protein